MQVWNLFHFYLCDTKLTWVYATALPAVCLCVTCMPCIKMAECSIKILSPPDSPIILGFHHRGSLLNSDAFTPNGGTEYKAGEKIG